MAWVTPTTVITGDLIPAATWNQNVVYNPIALRPAGIQFPLDGGGGAIVAGYKQGFEIPFDCTITVASLYADQTGSIVVDLWVDSYANYEPTNADSITGSAPMTITTAKKSTDSTLTGWTPGMSGGGFCGVNVDSCTDIEQCLVALRVNKD